MIRTQISLTEAQLRAARIEADRRDISIAALIRDALDQLLDENSDAPIRSRASEAVGGFRSGTSATSVDHDEALAGETRW